MKQQSILLSIFVLLFSISAFAQDVLINLEGDPINCKIVSVTETEIIYKTTEGNLKSLPKSEALMVQYANGEKINFQKNENSKVETKRNAIVTQSNDNGKEIKIEKNKYYLEGKKIKEKEVVSIIKLSNCEEGKNVLKTTKGAVAMSWIGMVLTAGGAGLIVANVVNNSNVEAGMEDNTLLYAGGGAVILGSVFTIISSSSYSKKVRKAVVEYNTCIK